jgi:xylulokinase
MAEQGRDVVLALDVGTSGARVAAYDREGVLVARGATDYPTYYEHHAWAEQEPEDWWSGAMAALHAAVSALDRADRVCAIGLTGQSPTIAPFDVAGHALRRALLYADNRAVDETQEWIARTGGRQAVHMRTGHDPEPFYIGPKLLWVQRHEPDIFARTHLWLQPRDFAAWRLTGECATDWSHAGSTLLFDIRVRDWADDVFAAMAIPRAAFPPARAPWSILGEVRTEVAKAIGLPLPTRVPVVLGGADSQCCVVGAGVLDARELSDMAGTSTCLNAPVPAPLADLRIPIYCHVVPGQWCTELGLNASGAAFDWLARMFAPRGAPPAFDAAEAEAQSAPAGAHDLIFLPYLADGERFNPALRGGFCGLSLRHEWGDLARAVLEGVAFAIREHLDTMAVAGAPVQALHVSGGGARVALWNQIKADVTGLPVVAVASDATSLGVALVAGAAVGLHPSLEEAAKRCVRVRRRYEPNVALASRYAERYARFSALAAATAEPFPIAIGEGQ